MAPYIFGERNGIHIIDLEQTVPMLQQGLQALRDVAASGGRILGSVPNVKPKISLRVLRNEVANIM